MSHIRRHRSLSNAVIIATVLLTHSVQAQPQVADLRSAYQLLNNRFAAGMADWRPAAAATGSLIFVAENQYSGDSQSDKRLRERRDEYANALFTLAKQAAEAGQLSLAFQWATETLRENPDHADARRVLGYEQRNGQWLTAYGAQMADAKEAKVWHPRFGWIAAADSARVEAGERLVNGRWVSAATDAARHTTIANGWVVRTDHFLVRTDHSLEAGVELAARLERLHQVWRQLFAGFYLSEREVRELFAGKRQPRLLTQPMRVFYYRNKDEYVAALAKRQPRIAETLGIYFDNEKESHFYAGDDASAGTLYHGPSPVISGNAADGAACRLDREFLGGRRRGHVF